MSANMTTETLFQLSGIAEQENYQTMDFAIPIRENGTYPHNGNAVAVYWRDRLIPEIVPYWRLAQLAIKRKPHLAGELSDLCQFSEEAHDEAPRLFNGSAGKKYSSKLAAYLWVLTLDGDGDILACNPDWGDITYRFDLSLKEQEEYGTQTKRWYLRIDSRGFVDAIAEGGRQ